MNPVVRDRVVVRVVYEEQYVSQADNKIPTDFQTNIQYKMPDWIRRINKRDLVD